MSFRLVWLTATGRKDIFLGMRDQNPLSSLYRSTDVLSQIISEYRMEAVVYCRDEFVAPWGMSLSPTEGASFHAVERGSCWLKVPGRPEPLALAAGDLVVVPNGHGHELADSPDTAVLPLEKLLLMRDPAGRVSMPSGPSGLSSTLVCGEFKLASGPSHPLFSLLPPWIHIQGEHGQSAEWLRTTLHFLAMEAGLQRPGYRTLVSRLVDILFVMVLRYWIDHGAEKPAGWLGALLDPKISLSLQAIHRSPDKPWSVEELAATAALSRAAFSARFTDMVGEPPLKYLTRWRIQLAKNMLDSRNETLENLAPKVGYDSAFAFSKAFKRIVGRSPGQYRREKGLNDVRD